MSDLFDSKLKLFKGAFEAAKPYADFIAAANEVEQAKWKKRYDNVTLSATALELSKSFTRKLNILMLAGTWCGDCSRHCPMVVKLAEAVAVIDLRFMDNETNQELRNELRIHGAARVPVMVGLSEDFFEVGRFGDRPLSAYRRKAAREAGASCAVNFGTDPAHELEEDVTGWLEIIERWQLLLRTSGMLRKRYND